MTVWRRWRTSILLFLAVLGIYGVMAFSVAQRSHELALRMALGATRGRLVGMVVQEGVILASVGLGLGLVGAYATFVFFAWRDVAEEEISAEEVARSAPPEPVRRVLHR